MPSRFRGHGRSMALTMLAVSLLLVACGGGQEYQVWENTEDMAAAMEAAGYAPRLIEGRADNLKITRQEDLALAEFYLTRRITSHPQPPYAPT